MKEDIKSEVEEVEKKESDAPAPKMRKIEIETDGNNIHLIKAEVNGKIELIGILQGIIGYLNQNNVSQTDTRSN